MGFLVLLIAIFLVRLTWRVMSRRSKPRYCGVYLSESYKRRIAASASDFQSRSEFAAMRSFK